MTIFFPDISSYEAGLTIQPDTVAVIAKATEGTYYRDAEYSNFKAQAAKVGAIFSAYHFLKAGNAAGQADYCHAMVGSTPVMLDVETEGSSMPTVTDVATFIARMHALGGRVWGAYIPRWYWQQVGGDLAALGVAIVSSSYTTYSDSGPGWAPYGGVTPTAWQYTNKQAYGGQALDFNAYKGTVQQLAALIAGTGTPTPSNTPGADMALTDIVHFSPELVKRYPELAGEGFGGQAPLETVLGWMAGRTAHLADTQDTAVAAAVAPIKAELDLVKTAIAALPDLINAHVSNGATADELAAAVLHHLSADTAAG
jgi:hypothetical protein